MFDFKFDWNKELECGVELLDEQHQELFRIGRDIEQLLTNGCVNASNTQLLNIIRSLRDFSSYYIYTVEMLMEKYRYPINLKQHNSLYNFRDNIVSIDLNELSENPQKVLTQVKEDLQNFLFDHILVEANKLGRFLNECGVH